MDIRKYVKITNTKTSKTTNEDDKREICKYGSECYQKNPLHHEKFKHPPKSVKEEKGDIDKRMSLGKNKNEHCTEANQVKKIKLDDSSQSKSVDERSNLSTDKKLLINKPLQDDNADYMYVDVDNVKESIKKIFLIEMPKDFYDFYEFCESIAKSPSEVHLALKLVGLELVGPFDILTGRLVKCTQEQAMIHWRYYYDPPEFLTILKGNDKSLYHIGYFRDEPYKRPSFVASNAAANGCQITILSDNVLCAFNDYLDKALKNANPFSNFDFKSMKKKLKEWCSKKNITLEPKNNSINQRKFLINSKTFHGAGIVVPYDKKTDIGYRPLAEKDRILKDMFQDIINAKCETERSIYWGKIQHVITFANIATDECDFGTNLELGIDMFCMGSEVFHRCALHHMSTAYKLLNREPFDKVIECHLKQRTKGNNLNFALSNPH